MSAWEIVLAFGIPSLLCSTIISIFVKRWEKRDKERQEKNQKAEEERHKLELLQVEAILATMSLSESIANAMKNGHTNGDMEEALEYEKKKKREINAFLRTEGVNSIK